MQRVAQTLKLVTRVSTAVAFQIALIFGSSDSFAMPATFGLGPDNNQELLISSIQSAKKSLLVNIYEMDEPIAEVLAERIETGLPVQILLEGSPAGKVSDGQRRAIRRLNRAFRSQLSNKKASQNGFYIMKVAKGESRRFRFDHAKYCIIDGKKVYITSENFTRTGHPDSGMVGNRGWDILLEDPSLVQQLTDMFYEDIDSSHGDIIDADLSDLHALDSGEAADVNSLKTLARSPRAIPPLRGEVKTATLITSPDSLDGILSVIDKAQRSLRVEEMSLPLYWTSGNKRINPIVGRIIDQAKQGISTQVLLNDDRVFGDRGNGKVRGNFLTVQYLQLVQQCQSYPIESKIVDVDHVGITYIHNKGILIDDFGVLISSINGTQNSVENNREVAVFVESQDASRYYGEAFAFDWSHSGEIDTDLIHLSEVDCSLLFETGRSRYELMETFWQLAI